MLWAPVYLLSQSVVSIHIDGSINPASSDFISRSIQKAAQTNATCIVIHLNTPGGLLKSTRVIVQDILSSPVPVVVYVSPGGAHAGSAGVFVTMSAHVAAMAPGTNIGAAHPVNMQGNTDSVMGAKSTNDAAAFIRAIAHKRNRNLDWAEDAVRNSVSITETEAVEKNVVDIIARNDAELLQLIDGKVVEVNGSTQTLHTKNAKIVLEEMSTLSKFLNYLSDPNIAYILMMIGFYGLLFELYSPGAIFPGIIGVISLILAFYAMHTLPINYAGLALIVFGIILFLLEIKVTSYGMLFIGGVISVLLGSFFLFRDTSALLAIKVSATIIIGITAFTTLFFLFLVKMGIQAQRLKPASGMEGLIGEGGETLAILNPVGFVQVHGEVWNAESVMGAIDKGQKIKVTAVKDLKLFVEQVPDGNAI